MCHILREKKKNGRGPRISQAELAICLQAIICQNVIFVLRQTIPKLMSNLTNSSSCQREVWRIIFEMCNDAVVCGFSCQNFHCKIYIIVLSSHWRKSKQKKSLSCYKRGNELLLPSVQQQPSSLSSGSLCLWREEARICSPKAKAQGRGGLVFRRFSSPPP